MKTTSVIENKIFEIRGHKVMLDYDLAELYEVETKRLNEQVKRNIERFPDDFMFRLTLEEWQNMWSQFATTSVEPNMWSQTATTSKKPMRSQIATALENDSMRSQIVTASQAKRNTSVTPFAFTEHGVTMLAGVLKSDKAIKMNIAIVRAFIALRQFAINYSELSGEIKQLREITDGHNIQLKLIYDALENLMDIKVSEKKWEDREPIGFKTKK